MYTDEQLQNLAEQVRRDQKTDDPAAAALAAKSIGLAIWSFANDEDWDGEQFVRRISPKDGEAIAKASRKLASALQAATSLMDTLRKRQIDGHDVAAALMGGARYKGVLSFGDAATPYWVHHAHRGGRIARKALKLIDDRKQSIEHYCWPRRIRELARGAQLNAQAFTPRVIGEIAHDMEIAAAFYEAIADEYSNSRGAQNTPGPLVFAACVTAWFDATGNLPSVHKRQGRGNRRTRPDLYKIITDLYGRPFSVGMSRETFVEVVKALNSEKAREEYRYKFQIALRKRTNPHEY